MFNLIRDIFTLPSRPSKTRTAVDLSDRCTLCGSTNIYEGGSWSPEKCLNCGAVYFMGQWLKENKKQEGH